MLLLPADFKACSKQLQYQLAKNSYMCLGREHSDNIAGNEYAWLHTGIDIGVKTLVLLCPSAKEGLVIFTNSDNGHLHSEKLIVMALGNPGAAFMKKAKKHHNSYACHTNTRVKTPTVVLINMYCLGLLYNA
jgi:hypothetical protein